MYSTVPLKGRVKIRETDGTVKGILRKSRDTSSWSLSL